jgi:hypothetical protein
MEIDVEGPFATRKDLPGGDPWGFSTADVPVSGGARRRRGDDWDPRSGSCAVSIFGQPDMPRFRLGPTETGLHPSNRE